MRVALAIPVGLSALACAAPAQSGDPGRRPEGGYEELRAGFLEPARIYAPFMFWFWDDPLDRERVSALAREMVRLGWNPGYVHARAGLPRAEWLSPEWFEGFGAALGEAEAAGAYLGYCDEYGWPSGQAAGRVLEEHPELAARSLDWVVRDVAAGETVELPRATFTVAARHARPEGTSVSSASLPRLGSWVWHPDAEPSDVIWSRRVLTVAPTRRITSATLIFTAESACELYVNGERFGQSVRVSEVSCYDLTRALVSGENALGIRARSSGGNGGLIAGLVISFEDGPVERIGSDSTWRCSLAASDGWASPGFDDWGWVAAAVVGASAASPPWSLAEEGGIHTSIRVESTSLRVIGAGDSFTWRAPDESSWRVFSFDARASVGLDGGRVNYLDRRLPAAFLAIAHDPYAAAFGEQLGRSIPGVFFDHEGDYGSKLAWSDDLVREYRDRTGRDIRRWMPLLVDEDAEGLWARARWDWHDAVSSIYADFLGDVSRWCAQRGMTCVSNLWEETLFLQAYAVGDFFQAQRAMTLPGTDALGEGVPRVHDFKETQSVAEFEGRRTQSEILGVMGWTMTPVAMKRALNSVTAWGVSHVVAHGVSLKRDLARVRFPPDLYTANPYWRYTRLWTDFARRASWVNAHGRAVPDVLLVHPMDSVWALLGGELYRTGHPMRVKIATSPGALPSVARADEIDALEASYRAALEDLTTARIEFLVADRHYLSAMHTTETGRLAFGEFEFRAAVLPALVLLPLESAAKLVELAEAGGAVYALGDLPRGSTESGLGCADMRSLMDRLERAPTFRRATGGVPELVSARATGLAPQVAFVSAAFPLIQSHRCIDGRDFFWLVNDSGERQECLLELRNARGAASIWDCESGAIRPLASRASASGSRVELEFEPWQAYWLVFDPEQPPSADRVPAPEWGEPATLSGPWRVRIDPAVQPAPAGPETGVPAALASGRSVERDLASWRDWELDHFTGFVDYETTFRSSAGGRAELDLGEVTHTVEVWLNGERIGARLWPPFTFDVSEALREGDNTLVVRVGNLLCNAMAQHVERGAATWTPRPPEHRDLDAGLRGPVKILRTPIAR